MAEPELGGEVIDMGQTRKQRSAGVGGTERVGQQTERGGRGAEQQQPKLNCERDTGER